MRICEYGCGREATYQFKNGKWCCENITSKCPAKKKELSNKKAFSIEYVKSYIEENNCTLLSTEYIHASSKLEVRCNKCNTIFYPTFDNFKNAGSRCPKCAIKKISKKLKHSDEYVKSFIEKEGYKWISGEYKNAGSILELQCTKGHKYKTKFDIFNSGSRCPRCYGNYTKTKEEIIEIINSKGYKWISGEYKNSQSVLTFECDKGHIYKTKFGYMNEGYRCPICANNAKLTKYVINIKYPFFSKVEEIREHPETKEIQVHCKNHNCKNSKKNGGWFTPTYNQLYNRISYIESGNDSCNFYCCEECKQVCPLYRRSARSLIKQDQIRAGQIPESYYTTEEYQTCREEVFKRDNNECLYCGGKAEHMHHIKPQKLEPFFSLDPDYCISVCSKCHYKYGHKDECSTGNLAQKVCA